MSRILAGVLVLAMAAVAGAGIPSADDSYVTMTNGGGVLVTCPLGDTAPYQYITVTALRSDLSPIQGIPSSSFFFTLTGAASADVSIDAVDAETDASGNIRFEASADGVVLYGSLTVTVQIYTVVVNDSDTLWHNTYDTNDDGDVNPIDFVAFAADFSTTNGASDYVWDGVVNPIDFVDFAAHWTHTAP